jgi:hypothetical protein
MVWNKEKHNEYSKKWNKQRPESLIKNQKKYRKKYPEKVKARVAISNAVKLGKIKRLPCEVCGNIKADAHHEDYDEPLEVVWLCRKHHFQAHYPIIIKN